MRQHWLSRNRWGAKRAGRRSRHSELPRCCCFPHTLIFPPQPERATAVLVAATRARPSTARSWHHGKTWEKDKGPRTNREPAACRIPSHPFLFSFHPYNNLVQ